MTVTFLALSRIQMHQKQVKLRLTKTSRGKKALGKIGFELVLNYFETGFKMAWNLVGVNKIRQYGFDQM